MIEIEIPHAGLLRLGHVVLDVNGTLALDGELLPGVEERISRLRQALEIHLITADTYGRQAEVDRVLDLKAVRLDQDRPEAEQKLAFVRGLGAEGTVAMGNGANDVLMLKEAELAIAILGPEGLISSALEVADAVVVDINAGLDLVLNPRRLVATLRR